MQLEVNGTQKHAARNLSCVLTARVNDAYAENATLVELKKSVTVVQFSRRLKRRPSCCAAVI